MISGSKAVSNCGWASKEPSRLRIRARMRRPPVRNARNDTKRGFASKINKPQLICGHEFLTIRRAPASVGRRHGSRGAQWRGANGLFAGSSSPWWAAAPWPATRINSGRNPAAVRQQVLAKLKVLFSGADVAVDSAHLALLGHIAVGETRLSRRDDPEDVDAIYIPSAKLYHDKEKTS